MTTFEFMFSFAYVHSIYSGNSLDKISLLTDASPEESEERREVDRLRQGNAESAPRPVLVPTTW